jgi:hypothetical protein
MKSPLALTLNVALFEKVEERKLLKSPLTPFRKGGNR